MGLVFVRIRAVIGSGVVVPFSRPERSGEIQLDVPDRSCLGMSSFLFPCWLIVICSWGQGTGRMEYHGSWDIEDICWSWDEPNDQLHLFRPNKCRNMGNYLDSSGGGFEEDRNRCKGKVLSGRGKDHVSAFAHETLNTFRRVSSTTSSLLLHDIFTGHSHQLTPHLPGECTDSICRWRRKPLPSS